MAASSRVSIQDGGQGNVKLHPYFAALIRWCISSIWTTATLLLHRLMTAPVQPITGPKLPKPRPASSEHLHPEPLVECVVLHQPPTHTLDVIFVHGLYGSLGNTWRQGEWRINYKTDPIKVPLRRPHSIPTACACKWDRDEKTTNKCQCDFLNDSKVTNKIDYNDKGIEDDEIYEKYRKVLPDDDLFITEKFYNNTLLDQVEIVGNFETQANFVRDLFEKNCEDDVTKVNCQCQSDRCLGCGCTCDDCYSPCWPRDWIKIDFPGARVLSVNYTSDPYLWRPLWKKESKRQRLHERADQMMEQLLSLGVGDKPIVWVGHSKGGLFIKQIYCEAYEAYLKINNTKANNEENKHSTENNIEDVLNGNIDKVIENNNIIKENIANEAKLSNLINYVFRFQNNKDLDNKLQDIRIEEQLENNRTNLDENVESNNAKDKVMFSDDKEDSLEVLKRANLWRNSVGFMFYSVPHRGSPLADIKTPITARSIELLEICKDCSLLMDLQSRWLQATEQSQPAVNSLVETCKTLMSLLWLRIVSVDSADPGIGALSGVSVDHREICKPSSRKCLLYRELKILIQNALNKQQR
ncbi:uncharacterized protein LOC106709369 [Papilio machaon]|uniref:uncharacterized protein LOC106709369 n=1 Tax=Papilio machaon TaxID=76193 RepID=UPI001E663669|nr:uncharacterized protein LOC106709369 [Papilio machaon]XP_045540929.1 uncharacterized protein LOC106709369 [Papilio machaon]